jgi:hypothetical protein
MSYYIYVYPCRIIASIFVALFYVCKESKEQIVRVS